MNSVIDYRILVLFWILQASSYSVTENVMKQLDENS